MTHERTIYLATSGTIRAYGFDRVFADLEQAKDYVVMAYYEDIACYADPAWYLPAYHSPDAIDTQVTEHLDELISPLCWVVEGDVLPMHVLRVWSAWEGNEPCWCSTRRFVEPLTLMEED